MRSLLRRVWARGLYPIWDYLGWAAQPKRDPVCPCRMCMIERGEVVPLLPLEAASLPVTDPRHRCVQGVCDDHAGPAS